MSDSDPEERSASADGFVVRKSLEPDEFRTPAIVFTVTSERSESARIRLREEIPEAIPIENVGFHPDYGGDHWSVEGDDIVFEREFDAGEEYETIYGVRNIDRDGAEVLLSEPQFDVLGEEPGGPSDGEPDEADDIGGLLSEGGTDAVRDLISGERDTLPGLEDEPDASVADESGPPAADAADESGPPAADAADASTAGDDSPSPPGGMESRTADGDGQSEGVPSFVADAESGTSVPEGDSGGTDNGRGDAGSSIGGPGDPSGSEAETGFGMGPSSDGVARALARELRRGNVSEDDRAEIRDALVDTEGSTRARINHLQARLSDLDAYIDALEAFLDEQGTATERFDGIDEDIDDLRGDLSRVEDRLDGAVDSIEEVEATVARIEDDLAGLEEIEDRLDDLESGMERLDDVEAEIDRLDDMEEELDRLDDMEEELDRLDDLEDEVDGIDFGEERDRIGSLEDELDDVRVELKEIDQFRERLSSALGAALGGVEVDSGDGADDAADAEVDDGNADGEDADADGEGGDVGVHDGDEGDEDAEPGDAGFGSDEDSGRFSPGTGDEEGDSDRFGSGVSAGDGEDDSDRLDSEAKEAEEEEEEEAEEAEEEEEAEEAEEEEDEEEEEE